MSAKKLGALVALLTCIALLASGLFASNAYAEDPIVPAVPTVPAADAVVVKVPVACAARPLVMKSLPTAEITACPQTAGVVGAQ
ncbi:MAG: hypothetical protein NT062_18925, partial [Proteobacteria bacterium]|nr:hypothetical protein [Pseudomonadota bacterium]